MAKYFSASTVAFYDTDIIDSNNLPEDSVLITDDVYTDLMSQQCGGGVIVAGTDGYPVVMDQICQPCTCIAHDKTIATSEQLGHVKVGEGISVTEDGTISVQDGVGGSSRNIGELVHSLIPLEDAGLHLLDGAKLPVDGIYNEFISHVASLKDKYSWLFLTEEEWQNHVSTYKSCGKFVYQEAETHIYYAFYNETADAYVYTRNLYGTEAESNDVNVYDSSFAVIGTGTLAEGDTLTYEEVEYTYSESNNLTKEVEPYLRLPKISDIIQSTTDVSELGALVEAGLPNIEASAQWKLMGYTTLHSTYQGAFFTDTNAEAVVGATEGVDLSKLGFPLVFDASLSNAIYGNSETVQPQTIKGLLYIVVATSVKTDIEVDIDNIATDLNGKADVDLINTVPTSNFATALNNAGIRTVVETWQSDDGTSWYRKWSDGWIEQGGVTNSSTAINSITVSFYTPFTQTPTVTSMVVFDNSSWTGGYYIRSISTTNFIWHKYSSASAKYSWYACGY